MLMEYEERYVHGIWTCPDTEDIKFELAGGYLATCKPDGLVQVR